MAGRRDFQGYKTPQPTIVLSMALKEEIRVLWYDHFALDEQSDFIYQKNEGEMMLLKITKILLILMTLILFAACSSTPQTETVPTHEPPAQEPAPDEEIEIDFVVNEDAPDEPMPTPRPTSIAADELIRTSGEGPGETDTFTLEEDTRIRVSWDQSSEGVFIMVVVRADPDPNNPFPERIVFEDVKGASDGYSDFDYFAGEYYIEIEQADGPWEVWAQQITKEGE